MPSKSCACVGTMDTFHVISTLVHHARVEKFPGRLE